MIDELEIDYRKEYYGDQERAHFYKEKIAGLGEDGKLLEEYAGLTMDDLPDLSDVAENMEKNGEYFRAIGYYQEAYDREEISYVQALEKIAENWIRLKEMEEAAACWKQILQVEMENRKADDGAWYHADLCCRLTSYLKAQGRWTRHATMQWNWCSAAARKKSGLSMSILTIWLECIRCIRWKQRKKRSGRHFSMCRTGQSGKMQKATWSF